jgi:AcrR family transcriptional regulator
MKSAMKMSGEKRREAILQAARRVFDGKGFHGTTTRELAAAAGVSEGLLFKHFPSKQALYAAMQLSCFREERAQIIERLEALEPSTASLVLLVHFMASHLFGERLADEEVRSFIRLTLRSVIDEGEFARLAVREGPAHWVRKAEACLEAAIAAGDTVHRPALPRLGGWFAHHLVAMIVIHLLPAEPVIDYGVPRKKFIEQIVCFILRGMGLKEEAIERYYSPEARRSLTFD